MKWREYIFSNDSKLAFWVPASIAALISQPDVNTSKILVNRSKQLWFKFLRVDSIKQHVSVVDGIAKDNMTTHWDLKNVVKVLELAKEYMLVSCLGVVLNYYCSSKDEFKELADPLYLALKGIISIPINIPGTTYNKAIANANIFREKIEEIIRKRKITMSKQVTVDNVSEDFLSKWIANCVENDDDTSDENLAREVIGFIVAGLYSTSTTIAFALAFVAENPHVYEMILKEQQEIASSKQPGDPLTWTDLKRMQYSWNVVCETMRLQPPSTGGAFRSALTDFTYAGFHISKGSKVFWSAYTTNMDPKYFKDPEKFDPSRFENMLTPYTFVPFGGGSHLCPGRDFARVLILVYVHHVIIRYKFTRVNPNEKIIFNPDPIPCEGLPMYLVPHVK